MLGAQHEEAAFAMEQFPGQTQDARQITDDAELLALRGLLEPILHDAIGLSTLFEEEQRGNAPQVEARRRQGILVHVEFGHPHPSRHLRGQLVDDGRDHLAGPAPPGPRVYQNRHRRALHLG